MADINRELNLDELEVVNGGVNFNGTEYTPQQLLDLYNAYPALAMTFIKMIIKEHPELVAKVVEEFKAAGLEIPAELLELIG